MKLHSTHPDWAYDGPPQGFNADGHKVGLTKAEHDAAQRDRIGNTPSCDLCGGLHGSDHDCQNHDHANEDASCSPDCEACKDTQPHPFDVMAKRGAAIRKYGHTTQSTEVETIDITPVGCSTPEGNKRVSEALRAFDDASANVANLVTFWIEAHAFNVLPEGIDDLNDIRKAIADRREKQEAFLRAVAGRGTMKMHILSFWYSAKHAALYTSLGDVSKNKVEIDGLERVYTCASSEIASEPYKDALTIFPDYQRIGVAHASAIRTFGKW